MSVSRRIKSEMSLVATTSMVNPGARSRICTIIGGICVAAKTSLAVMRTVPVMSDRCAFAVRAARCAAAPYRAHGSAIRGLLALIPNRARPVQTAATTGFVPTRPLACLASVASAPTCAPQRTKTPFQQWPRICAGASNPVCWGQ